MQRRITEQKMGLNAAWSMAVGGMVGGGIFSVLGVVILIAGKWAWLSFLFGGLIALATGYSYSRLTGKYSAGGGIYTFLRKTNHKYLSGSISWLLIFGYILTISVYAFTFGHYLANAIEVGLWLPKFSAMAITAILIWVNLRGVRDASNIEIFIVWGKILILLVIAGFGLYIWQPDMLTQGIQEKGIGSSLVGAASVFMAYEGFQLLAYDYDSIKNPDRTMPRGIILAIISVIIVYMATTIGATMLVGADTIIEQKEIAIAVAGQAAFGTFGLILATIAAVFSTGSAINATIFATARLTHDIAKNKELPGAFTHKNERGVPDYAVITIGIAGATLAMIGTIESLVQSASLVFLFTFATVNFLAYKHTYGKRWIFTAGFAGAMVAGLLLAFNLFKSSTLSLALLVVIFILALALRPYIMKKR